MRPISAVLAVAAVLLGAGSAVATPAIQVSDAAARVVVVPEARTDVRVVILDPNRRLPIRVWRFAGRIHVTGDLAGRLRGCAGGPGRPSAMVAGMGDVPYADLPEVVVHAPLDVRLFVSGAVWGAVGRSGSLDFSNAGCGDWIIANVQSRLRISLAGAGGARTGSAGYAELYSAGTGAIATRAVRRGAFVLNAGPGAVDMAEVDGPFTAKVAGAGMVRAASGRVTEMDATIAGAGGITLKGEARSLRASIAGSGDVRVTRVTGPVVKQVFGAGAVRIGS